MEWKKSKDLCERYVHNPILEPTKNEWESELIYNPGFFELGEYKFLLYRAMGTDHIARFGLAYSKNNTDFKRLEYPVVIPTAEYEIPSPVTLTRERERGGIEDPRTIIMDNKLYIYYTGFSEKCHLAMIEVDITDFLNLFEKVVINEKASDSNEWNELFKRKGLVFPELYKEDVFSRNSIVYKINNNKYMMLYRINKDDINYCIAGTPIGPWVEEGKSFITKTLPWETERNGVSTPVIELEFAGIKKEFMLYHGTNKIGELDRLYSIGVIELINDGNQLEVIKKEEAILAPNEPYETDSEWLNDHMVQAVFPCGVASDKEYLYIYYGAGDMVISVARIKIEDLFKLKDAIKYKIEI